MITDLLLEWLERPDVVERMRPVEVNLHKLNKFFSTWGEWMAAEIQHAATLPPSRGYQPLLVEHGFDPVLARAMADLTVRIGTRAA